MEVFVDGVMLRIVEDSSEYGRLRATFGPLYPFEERGGKEREVALDLIFTGSSTLVKLGI